MCNVPPVLFFIFSGVAGQRIEAPQQTRKKNLICFVTKLYGSFSFEKKKLPYFCNFCFAPPFFCPIHFAPGWIYKKALSSNPGGRRIRRRRNKWNPQESKWKHSTTKTRARRPVIKSGTSFVCRNVLHVFKLIDAPFGVAFADLP